MIESFWTTPDFGDLMVVNGVDVPLIWDGFTSGMEPVGNMPPSTAPTLGGSGTGAIVGTYWGFVRFIDRHGNPSDLSPISASYTAQGTTGTITLVTNTTPLVVTSAAHGLTTGNWVKISGVGGITATNDTWQITVISASKFSLDGSDGDGITDYTGGGTWQSGIHQINYTTVAAPTEGKIVRKQILRNTDGQATTFYVDVDTTNLSGTSFSSTRIDSDLQNEEAVPILDSLNSPFANRNARPLSYFKAVCEQLNLMFMAGILEYNIGSCIVTFGSTTVAGVGTAWKGTLSGRFLYVQGASKTYEIVSVNESLQTLTLTEAYADNTDQFAFYSIKPPPAYRRVVQFSVPGFPESWPAFNGLSLQETGDEITGLMQMGAYLYIIEKAHIHKLTFAQSPITDGGVFMVATRGCVNNRCWVTVDAGAYLLDELGIYKFGGNSAVEQQSIQIQDIFRGESDIRINWRWKEYFHAVLDLQQETIRWFVSLDGNRYPRHALAFQYRNSRWWIEEYPVQIGGTCAGYLNGFTGTPQIYYGGSNTKVFAAWTGTLDIVDPSRSVSGGTVMSSTSFTLTSSEATLPDAVNFPVAIRAGAGEGQVRQVISVDGSTMILDRPWSTLPDSSSLYQTGAIRWLYRSSWMRLMASENMAQRRFEMLFEQLVTPMTATLQFFNDFQDTPELQAISQRSKDGAGIEVVKGSGSLVIDLTWPGGLVDRQLPAGKEYFIRGKRHSQFLISGFTGDEQVKMYQFLYEGGIGEDK